MHDSLFDSPLVSTQQSASVWYITNKLEIPYLPALAMNNSIPLSIHKAPIILVQDQIRIPESASSLHIHFLSTLSLEFDWYVKAKIY